MYPGKNRYVILTIQGEPIAKVVLHFHSVITFKAMRTFHRYLWIIFSFLCIRGPLQNFGRPLAINDFNRISMVNGGL